MENLTTSSNDKNFILCLTIEPSSIVYNTYLITSIVLLLPLCTFILLHGLQQWRKNSSSSAAAASHSECFTYHMVLMELICVLGSFVSYCAFYNKQWKLVLIGHNGFIFALYGEIFLHLLTCVERYLAVVHPITYMRLKNRKGIRIRNATILCVWLLCLIMASFELIDSYFFNVLDLSLMHSSIIVVSFCSLSVLFVLIRPGPGKRGGTKTRLDPSKKKAFYTIVTILAVLLLRFTSSLAWVVNLLSKGRGLCWKALLSMFFSVPSRLVLPLLFLHKKRKVLCFRKNTH